MVIEFSDHTSIAKSAEYGGVVSKIGLVRNPRSGRGANERSWDEIERALHQALPDHEWQIEVTVAPGSAITQARAMAEHGCSVVIGAGGDGTVCDVMQGVLDTDAALAVLPLGTGNDFARTIGIGASLPKAIETIRSGTLERIDIAKWTMGNRTGYFLNAAGCGFDAVVAQKVNEGVRRLRGRPAYLAAIFLSLIRYSPTELALTVDGEKLKRKSMLCALANAQSYGGGMKIAPLAELKDGLLDLVLVGDLGKWEFLCNFPKVLKGTHLALPKVEHRTFRRLEIESDPPVPFLADGELLPPGKLVVEVVPRALDVLMP